MLKNKANDKKSFVMYDSFLEAMKHLNDAEFRECVLKIRDYALDGVDEESNSPMVNVIMSLAKPNLDSARRRYVASVENGKKGAEFGKLGGAPKGNKNASKKQPLKQPLNVDDNEDVNENGNVDVNADATTTPIGLESSFNSSIQGVNNQIENDSEQFEEQKERKEPHNGSFRYCSNDCSVSSANENKGEASLYSNDDGFVSPGTEPKTSRVDAAARHQQKDEGGMSMSEYVERVIANSIGRLAKMKLQGKELDKGLLNSTIDNMIALYNHHDRKSAYKVIMQGMDAMITNNLI
jgi:hypothetical protein